MNIGFVGLGRMGAAMAARLLAASHRVAVFDANPAQVARLVGLGAESTASLAAVATARDVVITMLPSDPILLTVTTGAGGLRESLAAGAIHMVCGTHGVGAMRAVRDAHRDAGQCLVACHVLGRPDLAATGKLGLVPGGAAEAIERIRPILGVLGERVFVAGEDPLSATAIKIANNFLLGSAIEAMGEGMALVRKYGVDPALFHQVLVGGLFNCTAYQAYGDLIAHEDWGRIGATAVIGLKDADLALDAAKTVSVPLPSAAIWKAHLEAAIARGEENLDWSVMARQQYRESGLE